MATLASTSKDDEQQTDGTFIAGYTDINEFTQATFKLIMGAIKSSNDMPSSGDDFDYYSSFESFRTLMDMEGSRILHIIQKILRYHAVRGNITSKVDQLDTEDRFDVLVDANDQLLERVGNFLDEAAGVRKQETPLVIATATAKSNKLISGSWNKKTPPAKGQSIKSNYRLLAAKNIQRPQLKFQDKIDNTSRPFVPKIKNKPNALKPLAESLQIDDSKIEDCTEGFQFPHPYQYELDHWTPLQSQLEKGVINEPIPTEECSVQFIDTENELKDLVQLLMKEKEIAVDLEHHSYRSFQGITCLMQLSTRTQDFIVDTIALRSGLHVLNQVFTDPTIVKLFHGADLDVEWLQRDLGLYVVNMFDTGQAARVLNLQRFSLAHLLMTYCHVEADKQYQLADWRIRPLPKELVHYAQEDTHYLLYIYDRLRTELIDRGNEQNNLLVSVLRRSKAICEKTYKKPIFSRNNYLELYKRTKKVFNSQQLYALEGIFAWRDAMARTEDESLGYVLPNHMLMQICEVLPREPQGILACCNPIPPLLRQNQIEIHNSITAARDKPLVKQQQPSPKKYMPTKSQHPMYNVDSLLLCPHDMSHQDKHNMAHIEVDVPVTQGSSLFKDHSDIHICDIELKESPTLTALGNTPQKTKALPTGARRKAEAILVTFVNPIEKFLPDTILKKVERGKVAQLTQVEEKWKLLPHTKKAPPPKTSAPIPQHTLSSADVTAVTIDEPEQALSVRQQYPKVKKRDSDGLSDVLPKKIKEENSEDKTRLKDKDPRRKKSGFLAPNDDFKAYDYSQTDYKVFDKSDQKNSRKHYDPDASGSRGKNKRRDRGRGHTSSGKKSMTYSKGDSDGSKIQWPKR